MKPKKSLPDKLVPEANPGLAAASDENMLEAAHDRIRAQLPEKYHPMWDHLADIRDTNESIRLHMTQMQMQMQVAYAEYWERKKHMDEELLDAIDADGYGSEGYEKKLEKISKEQESAQKHMTQIVRVHSSLAKEYRQCAMQKRYTVHITLVSQLIMAVQAAIHQHVHDQTVLNAISTDLERSMSALFPMGAGSEG